MPLLNHSSQRTLQVRPVCITWHWRGPLPGALSVVCAMFTDLKGVKANRETHFANAHCRIGKPEIENAMAECSRKAPQMNVCRVKPTLSSAPRTIIQTIQRSVSLKVE